MMGKACFVKSQYGLVLCYGNTSPLSFLSAISVKSKSTTCANGCFINRSWEPKAPVKHSRSIKQICKLDFAWNEGAWRKRSLEDPEQTSSANACRLCLFPSRSVSPKDYNSPSSEDGNPFAGMTT